MKLRIEDLHAEPFALEGDLGDTHPDATGMQSCVKEPYTGCAIWITCVDCNDPGDTYGKPVSPYC